MMANKSNTLKELRNMAISITRENRISVIYKKEAETACIDLHTLQITLSPQIIPKSLHDNEKLFNKCLDGQLLHEAGHFMITKPILSRYERMERNSRLPKLMHTIINIVEDKRVNHFIEKRYRFDIGSKLKWFRSIMNDAIKARMLEECKENSFMNESIPSLMLNQLIHIGLYDGKLNTEVKKVMDKLQQKDLEHALNLLEKAKYTWVKNDLIKICSEIYHLIEKNVKSYKDNQDLLKFVPKQQNKDGEFEPDLDKEAQKTLKEQFGDEKEGKNTKDDLKKGGGCGVSRGELIPAPPSRLGAYLEYVNRNQPEITNLLNKLKQFIKPVQKRLIFQKRGRIMSPIISKAYSNSLRRSSNVNRIFIKSETFFEKQKVALAFAFDFSGSVDYDTACNIITIMNEVFGSWLDDESYAITVFAKDYQKVKTFFETYEQTKGRIGGINVNMCSTMSGDLCKEIRKMFHSITNEKQKVFIFCTDFGLGDKIDTQEVIEGMINDGVQVLFLGICDYWDNYASYMPNQSGIKRAKCENLSELPEKFINIYLDSIGNANQTQ